MLVLTRKVGEKVVVGDQITIVVSRVAGNRVTLGIEAPLEVSILRGELSATVSSAATESNKRFDKPEREEKAVALLAD